MSDTWFYGRSIENSKIEQILQEDIMLITFVLDIIMLRAGIYPISNKIYKASHTSTFLHMAKESILVVSDNGQLNHELRADQSYQSDVKQVLLALRKMKCI